MQQPIEKMLLKCVVIKHDQSIRDMLRMLSADKSNFIAVVDGAGKVVGVATENDLLKLMKLQPIAGVQAVVTQDVKKNVFDQPVSGIMTREPKKVKKDATTREVMNIMLSSELRYIAVVDDENKPLGYVRLSEVMKRVVEQP